MTGFAGKPSGVSLFDMVMGSPNNSGRAAGFSGAAQFLTRDERRMHCHTSADLVEIARRLRNAAERLANDRTEPDTVRANIHRLRMGSYIKRQAQQLEQIAAQIEQGVL